jgi:hypothetical protein
LLTFIYYYAKSSYNIIHYNLISTAPEVPTILIGKGPPLPGDAPIIGDRELEELEESEEPEEPEEPEESGGVMSYYRDRPIICCDVIYLMI